jgi:hypothetical protein
MSELSSIVIPVHDRAGVTSLCLDRILTDPPEAPFEVIVVDGGRELESLTLPARANVLVVSDGDDEMLKLRGTCEPLPAGQ